MKETKELAETGVSIGDKDHKASAVAILEAISAHESKLQIALAEVYTSMDDKVLKDMRRTLPLTGQHFDWTGRMATYVLVLHVYRVGMRIRLINTHSRE